jgi:hypothetical protein
MQPIDLNDPRTWPIPGSIWRHRNGNFYRVFMFANTEQDRQDEYPTTIVYTNIKNGHQYSRRLDDWDRSMDHYAIDLVAAIAKDWS